MLTCVQLEQEKNIKNATIWGLKEYYANYSTYHNTTDIPPPEIPPADVIRGPCWETDVGIVRTTRVLPPFSLYH